MAEPERPHEIVIIRRGRHDDHDDHHGGVWKIAFADFMTAMMAFFLVLWIVNSSSKETRSSIALYFNPVQLSNSTAARKGLQDPKRLDFDADHTSNSRESTEKQEDDKGSEAVTGQDGSHQRQEPAPQTEKPPGDAKKPKNAADVKPAPAKPGVEAAGPAQSALKQAALNETALFRDPYAVLSEIAASREEGGLKKEARERPPEANSGRPGLNASETFRDPFEPVVPVLRRQALETANANQIANTPDVSAQPPRSIAGEGSVPVNAAPPSQGNTSQGSAQSKPTQDKPVWDKPGSAVVEETGTGDSQTAKLKVLLDQALKDEDVKKAPRIELKATPEGTLISLTDDLDFGMFKIGSAEPDPKTVRVMAKIGTILKSIPGAVVVRGHTDARAYRTASGDNWRLSSSRAQMAFYMLVRGGFDEKRFDRVEGHADRHLKNAASPYAAENRRIEILIRKDRS